MKDLFIKTDKGNIPIEKSQIEKYNLKQGTISPNNGYHIVDKNGNEKKEENKVKLSDKHTLEEANSEGVTFTQSEIIDLAQAADSEDIYEN